MHTAPSSKSKLWIGFALMCAAVLVWTLFLKFTIGSMEFPAYRPGQSTEELDAQMARLKNPMSMMTGMMVGYAVSGMIFVGGLVLTGLGMIDYADDLRRRC